jgi:Cysteine-rich secretory protein family
MVVRSLFRRSTVVAVAIGCLATPAITTQADAGGNYRFKRSEKCFMRKINNVRHRHGLESLSRDKQLGYVARVHAREMSADASVWDDPAVGHRVTHWSFLANNTGRGSGCRELNNAFRASWPHKANMIGHFHFVGVGVTWRNGIMYVSENFEAHSNPGNIYSWP